MLLDIFKNDPFQFTELTQGINKLPHAPTRLGNSGLFTPRGIFGLTLALEMQSGVISLVQTSPRGSPSAPANIPKRTMRDFRTVHMSGRVAVVADEVMSIRSFGTEQDIRTMQELLNEKMVVVKRNLDVTAEWQRVGALKGVLLDADGTTVIYDFFSVFGVTQQTLDMDLDVSGTKVRTKCHQVYRMIEDEMGGIMFDGVRAYCSPEFFDSLIDHDDVTDTFTGTGDASQLRRSVRMQFDYGSITWEEYRGQVGTQRFIETGCAYAVPTGVPDMFMSYYSPADYTDAAGTRGVPYYMQPNVMDFNRGVEWEIQTNPLQINTRPRAVIKLGRQASDLA